MKRRDFLRLSALAGVGGFALRPGGAGATSLPGDGYKALVIIMLPGGNDAFNMLIPMEAGAYGRYASPRGSLAVSNTALSLPEGDLERGRNPYWTGAETDNAATYRAGVFPVAGQPLAVNGVMPELARMLGEGSARAVLNTGNLVRPVDRQQLADGVAELPLFLFAHNHQQRQIALGRADALTGAGWAGQLADRWFGGYDENLPLGLNISLAGNNRMQSGSDTSPLVLPASGPISFDALLIDEAMDDNADRLRANRRALHQYLMGVPQAPLFESGRPDPQDYRQREAIAPESLLEQAAQRFGNRSREVLERLTQDWQETLSRLAYTSADSYGNRGADLFAVPSAEDLNLELAGRFGDFIAQMEAIATMVKLGSDRGYQRHVFFAQLGSFDTHSNQAHDHPALLRELSLGLDKFQKAMGDLGLADAVMALTLSDFGRTVSNNGDGTDHGWGTHQIVVGGGMHTPGMIGAAPDLALGSDDDYSDKGRIIPSIANDQLLGTAVHWFGVDLSELDLLLPNLRHFATAPSDLETALLDGLLG